MPRLTIDDEELDRGLSAPAPSAASANEQSEDTSGGASSGRYHSSATNRAARSTVRQRRAAVAVAVAPLLWPIVRNGPAVVDGIAILLPALVLAAVALMVVATAIVNRSWALPTITWVTFGLLAVFLPARPVDGGPVTSPVRIVTANLDGFSSDERPAARAVIATNPDIAVFTELRQDARNVLDLQFPHAEAPSWVGGVGVYSTLPLKRLTPPALGIPAARIARVEVEHPTQPFVLYAIHLPRPFPFGQEASNGVGLEQHRTLVRRLANAVELEALPVVIAGDLNLSDRTWGYRHLTADLRDVGRSGDWTGATATSFALRPLALRIDHLLTSQEFCGEAARRVDLPGSDHRGVQADIGPCEPGT
jgi:hypothetical protein